MAGASHVWGKWLNAYVRIEDFGRERQVRIAAFVVPLLALALLGFVLKRYASADVRDDSTYLFFYLSFGLAWLGLVLQLAGMCGLSFRDDWLERRNPAAAAAGSGVLLGGMSAFAGGNIGDGPGWWVVLFCAILSTAAFFLTWWLYARVSGIMDQIVIDRDVGSGLRLSAFLCLAGIVTGRSVAGDWTGLMPACEDFCRLACPLLPYTLGVAAIERRLSRFAHVPLLSYSLTWIFVHLVTAILFLISAGPFQ